MREELIRALRPALKPMSALQLPLIARWRRLSSTLGSWVRVSGVEGVVEGEAVDIDTDGALLLQERGGTVSRIISGDVSLRGLDGRYV